MFQFREQSSFLCGRSNLAAQASLNGGIDW